MTISNLSRREFLTAALAGAAMAAVSNTALAAMNEPELILNIYKLTDLHDEIVKLNSEKSPQLNQKFNEFFDFVATAFPPPPSDSRDYAIAIYDLHKLTKVRSTREEFRGIPPTLHPTCIGVAAAMSLMGDHKVTLMPMMVPKFSKFASMVAPMVQDLHRWEYSQKIS